MKNHTKVSFQLLLFIFIYCLDLNFCYVLGQHLASSTSNITSNEIVLDFVTLTINGRDKQVKNNDTIQIALGDKFIIKNAMLSNRNKQVSYVNLVGFVSPKTKTNAGDQGYEINTATDLMSAWAIKNNVYKIDVYYLKQIVGSVFIEITEPKLEQITIDINGTPHDFKTDDIIKVKSEDKFKIQKIKTNINDPNEEDNVEFQIVPITKDETTLISLYEIRFLRNKKVFGRLLMHVQK